MMLSIGTLRNSFEREAKRRVGRHAPADQAVTDADAVGGSANADQFLRYDIAPGVNHCAGGPGADSVDLLSALDRWVTRGRAPGNLTATRFDPATGNAVLSRPLCRHPAYPHHRGRGDVNAASSFSCRTP